MGKRLVLLTALAILVAGAYAQVSSWTNPYDDLIIAMPQSIPSVVTNGALYDGADAILATPLDLSDYGGVSMFGSFGNFDSWTLHGNVDVSEGVLIPFGETQGGLVGRFLRSYADNLTGWQTEPSATFKAEATNAQDGDSNGKIAYTTAQSYSYADQAVARAFGGGTGLDLGFMGLSLFGSYEQRNRSLGGAYDYSWTAGTDTAEFSPTGKAVTTAKTVKYGFRDGKVDSEAIGEGTWKAAATAQLPLWLKDIPMPLSATVKVGGARYGIEGRIPQSVSITEAYVSTDGAAGTASAVSRLSYKVGLGDLNSASVAGSHLGTGLALQKATMAAAAAASALDYALVAGGYRNQDFNLGLAVGVDPKFALSPALAARTRAKLDLGYVFWSKKAEGEKSVLYERADSGTGSKYSYEATVGGSSETTKAVGALELGGSLEAGGTDGPFIVSTGFFYYPKLDLSFTTRGKDTSSVTALALDTTASPIPEATSATTLADIGLGKMRGKVVQTATTTYAGQDRDVKIAHRFAIPISAQLRLVKGKLSFMVGGLLSGAMTSDDASTAGSETSTVTEVYDSVGTLVSADPAVAVKTTTPGSARSSLSSMAWEGAVNFMLRWTPDQSVTVDIFGKTLTDTLNMDLFQGGEGGDGAESAETHDGFSMNFLPRNLGMSVTFRL